MNYITRKAYRFTFYSSSIKSTKHKRREVLSYYLHSTLVLLKGLVERRLVPCLVDLHSTLVLLKGVLLLLRQENK